MGGFVKTVSGYISFGNANVLRTVILPMSDSFHLFHVSNVCLFTIYCAIFGSRFKLWMLVLLSVKVIPKVAAWFDQLKGFSWQNLIVEFLREPTLITLHIVWFNRKQEISQNLSNVLINVSKDRLHPSKKKLASSAKRVCFTSTFDKYIPYILVVSYSHWKNFNTNYENVRWKRTVLSYPLLDIKEFRKISVIRDTSFSIWIKELYPIYKRITKIKVFKTFKNKWMIKAVKGFMKIWIEDKTFFTIFIQFFYDVIYNSYIFTMYRPLMKTVWSLLIIWTMTFFNSIGNCFWSYFEVYV